MTHAEAAHQQTCCRDFHGAVVIGCCTNIVIDVAVMLSATAATSMQATKMPKKQETWQLVSGHAQTLLSMLLQYCQRWPRQACKQQRCPKRKRLGNSSADLPKHCYQCCCNIVSDGRDKYAS